MTILHPMNHIQCKTYIFDSKEKKKKNNFNEIYRPQNLNLPLAQYFPFLPVNAVPPHPANITLRLA